MRPLGRRLLFALLPAAPLAVVAAVKAPAAQIIDGGALETLNELAASLQEWKPAPLDEAHWDKIAAEISSEIAAEITRMQPRARDLAATLGTPYDGPRDWTNDEVALTLGIDVQRDGIVIDSRMVRA